MPSVMYLVHRQPDAEQYRSACLLVYPPVDSVSAGVHSIRESLRSSARTLLSAVAEFLHRSNIYPTRTGFAPARHGRRKRSTWWGPAIKAPSRWVCPLWQSSVQLACRQTCKPRMRVGTLLALTQCQRRLMSPRCHPAVVCVMQIPTSINSASRWVLFLYDWQIS